MSMKSNLAPSSLVTAEKVADHTLISIHFTIDCTHNLVTVPIYVASGIKCGWFKTIVGLLNSLARKMCINSLIPISISDYIGADIGHQTEIFLHNAPF